jgi:hypothetical protein
VGSGGWEGEGIADVEGVEGQVAEGEEELGEGEGEDADDEAGGGERSSQ